MPHPIDRQYGIETSGTLGFNQLRSGKSSDVYNASYGGSQPSIIRRALRIVPNCEGVTFLDLGCGKGRALAVASEFPFSRIIGVDLVPHLVETGRRNAEIISRCYPTRTPITVHEGDAAEIEIPDGQVVIYFFHPFYRRIMSRVAKNIERWVLKRPGNKAYVIYYNPMYFDIYDRSPVFRRVFAACLPFDDEERGTGVAHEDHEDSVVIWESLGGPMLEPHPGAWARVKVTPPGWRSVVVACPTHWRDIASPHE